jgi:hypothetical protein
LEDGVGDDFAIHDEALVAPVKPGVKKQPSAEYPCAKCGSTSHWYRDCPQVPQDRRDRYKKVLSKVPAMTAASIYEMDCHMVLEEAKSLWAASNTWVPAESSTAVEPPDAD